MLTRRTFAIGAATVLVLAATLTTGGPAGADPGANCPPGQDNCDVFDNENGNTGGGGSGNGSGNGSGGGGGPRECKKDDGTVVPCFDDLRGWFNSADDCYYKVYGPQQPPETPPGQTAYLKSCGNGGSVNASIVYLDDPPPGFDPPDPEELARDLLGRVLRTPPDIRTAPADAPGLVGVPVWLYDASGWDPVEANDGPIGGVTVWIEASPTRIVWTMGDGERRTCRSAGVAFRADVHDPRRPPGGACSYEYGQPSSGVDGGKYRITAIKHYTVRWGSNIGGEGDPIEAESPISQTTIQIDELQVVTR
ncbi:hypothetical protein [Plantactinospora sonchi]|uniref:ATP/GTP-binding protein n=1 Tax=Plantactinospora sonchi TaxID=1544735 RepID=A0ABU7RNU3_9ACTN